MKAGREPTFAFTLYQEPTRIFWLPAEGGSREVLAPQHPPPFTLDAGGRHVIQGEHKQLQDLAQGPVLSFLE